MVGWHHQLNGHEFEQTSGDSEGQDSLAGCSPWGQRVGHNLATEQQEQYYPSGFPGGSVVKNPPANAGDVGSGRSPGGGNGNLFQCSCLENSMDYVHGAAKSRTQLSDFHFHSSL